MFVVFRNFNNFLSHVQNIRTIVKFDPSQSFHQKMKQKFNYEEAIGKLNNLQSNATIIKEAIGNIFKQKEIRRDSILRYLSYTGYEKEHLNQLSVIHIAGTKGKGSTSAMCESILRNHGYKTGFYSSPHLLSVTERIRINGIPLQEEQFAKVFSNIYQQLLDNTNNENDMPPYFGFLTVMALNIFISEKVDVAIIEVGIGGEYDQTNVVSNVPVAGITSLGYDHMNLLGNTIEEIARQKAGIMKPESKVYTVEQPIEAMKVLRDTALARKCCLTVVPEYKSYNWLHITDNRSLKLSNPTKYLNASLAIQLAHNWMIYKNSYRKTIVSNVVMNDKNDNIVKDLPWKTFIGVESCFWPGRCQILKLKNEDYYIDGAHTVESMTVCSEWFKHNCRHSSPKILIFYLTGDRNPEPLLKLLLKCDFDMALFVPNIAYDEIISKNPVDQICTNSEYNKLLEICNTNRDTWKKLVCENQSVKDSNTDVFNNVFSAFEYISKHFSTNGDIEKPQVLITGSLLLVGAALSILDPSLKRS